MGSRHEAPCLVGPGAPVAQHHLPCQEIPEAGRQEESSDCSLPGFPRVLAGGKGGVSQWTDTDVQERSASLSRQRPHNRERERQLTAERINREKKSVRQRWCVGWRCNHLPTHALLLLDPKLFISQCIHY